MKFILSAVAAFTFSACQSTVSLPSGQYSGTLYERHAEVLASQPVRFSIGFADDGQGTLTIQDANENILHSFALSRQNTSVSVAGLSLGLLTKDGTGQPCFANVTTKICYSAQTFSFEQFDASSHQEILGLFGVVSNALPRPSLESPRKYSLEELIHLALSRNFNSRIEYEHAMQAKLSAKSAYLQLLPHISASSLLSSASGPIGVLSALGDFVPFLLPNRWFEAQESDIAAKLEQDTRAIMQADLVPEVEGLVYVSLQDEATRALYKQLMGELQVVYQTVLRLEAAAQLPAGSADQLLSSLQLLQLDAEGLDVLVTKDHAAIAQALGFMNTEAISGIDLGAEVGPIETAAPMQPGKLLGFVLDRAPELHQIGDLKLLAQLQEGELSWDWLDPSYDSSHDLGFALTEEVQISKSKVQEIELVSAQMEQGLEHTLNDASGDYNLAIQQHPELISHFTLQQKRWATVIAQVFPGTTLNTLDIQSILSDYLAAGISIESTKLSFRVARARLDRLLLQNADSIFIHAGANP